MLGVPSFTGPMRESIGCSDCWFIGTKESRLRTIRVGLL